MYCTIYYTHISPFAKVGSVTFDILDILSKLRIELIKGRATSLSKVGFESPVPGTQTYCVMLLCLFPPSFHNGKASSFDMLVPKFQSKALVHSYLICPFKTGILHLDVKS